MSATLTDEIHTLKTAMCRQPAILKLEDAERDTDTLTQYYVECTEDDKFLLIYVILKLKLLHGKCLVFINDLDRCYRVKLFLEQFGIRSCVLNAELPLNSRYPISLHQLMKDYTSSKNSIKESTILSSQQTNPTPSQNQPQTTKPNLNQTKNQQNLPRNETGRIPNTAYQGESISRTSRSL